jgi:hypothetical protein
MGRPVKLTDEVKTKLLQALAFGATQRLAAEYAGVGESTFRAWMASKRGAEFLALQAAVKEATAKGSVGALAKIQKAATDGQWQAAAWLLERRHPEEYGRRQIVALTRAPIVAEPADLEAAAVRGVGLVDAAVIWQRQLSAVEAGYTRGELDLATYLERMDRLSAQAARMAELRLRNPAIEGSPHVSLSLSLDSPAILGAGQSGVVGDAIDVG